MKSKYAGLAFLSFLFSLVNAQEKLPSDTFRVVKEYQPTLIDANKISFEPVIDDSLKIDLDLNYTFINKQVPVSFELEPIPPAKIKGEPLIKLYNGYARLGVGNALVPFGEVYYTNLRSKKFASGVHASYLNMAEVNNMKGSDMDKMHLEVFGKRFWKTNTLDARLGFDRHAFNYYGYYRIPGATGASELPNSDLEQYYNKFSASATLASTKRDSFNLRHSGTLEYFLTSNKSSLSENNIKAKANLNQFRNSELYNLDIELDYNSYEGNQDNTIFALKPQISTIGDKFRINAGLGIYMNAGNTADFHFFPLAEVKYNVIEDVLVPYAGVKGEIRRVNYNTITSENPFVSEDIALANSNEKYNLYLGLRGTLSSKLSFNVRGASIKTDNAYLYVQVPDTNRVLSKDYFLTYDEIDELQIRGELVYRLNEKIKVYAQGEYFSFDTDKETEAWHRPALKVSTSASYNLRDKILLSLDLIYWGEQYARDLDPVNGNNTLSTPVFKTKTLDAIFDANLGVEYRYTKRLSAFVKFNNIGGINFEKYKDYPTQGFNVWGGLTYAF
jgi:hypothetical protein